MSFENIGKRETLPEKVSRIIKEAILSGEMIGGEPLPTEPELEKQFGVSRAVIRDAMRMLKAQGLIVVKHGKGMYVSHSQLESFTDALLTSLRRDNASAWDIEQFEQIFLPQVFAVASMEATAEDLQLIRDRGRDYIAIYKKLYNNDDKELTSQGVEVFRAFMKSIFDSTKNKMISLIGEVLISMRAWRTISDVDESTIDIIKMETKMIEVFISAIETHDPRKAAEMIRENINFDNRIIDILKKTPVGTSPEIPGDTFKSAYKHLNN